VDRSRRELLANLSHELRTPLSRILSESTASLGEGAGFDEAERRLRAIAGEAQRLKARVFWGGAWSYAHVSMLMSGSSSSQSCT
jgi:signal transduction histidine kinase